MFEEVHKHVKAARKSEALAAKVLAELLPPGTRIEFRQGNMACIANATIVDTGVPRWPEVCIHNEDTGVDRVIPLEAIVRPLDEISGKPRVYAVPAPICDQCGRDMGSEEKRIECNCGAMLCSCCYGNCRECEQ